MLLLYPRFFVSYTSKRKIVTTLMCRRSAMPRFLVVFAQSVVQKRRRSRKRKGLAEDSSHSGHEASDTGTCDLPLRGQRLLPRPSPPCLLTLRQWKNKITFHYVFCKRIRCMMFMALIQHTTCLHLHSFRVYSWFGKVTLNCLHRVLLHF